tara:strand:- start:464 stop:676 length:213 start_codon:yes stop_codon:yes gene_type:complete
MISVSSEEVDLYLEKIEEVITVLNSIDYSVDPYDPSQDSEKTPHFCVGYSKGGLRMLHHVIQDLKKYDKD